MEIKNIGVYQLEILMRCFQHEGISGPEARRGLPKGSSKNAHQRLAHRGLVEQVEGKGWRGTRYWKITEKGMKALRERGLIVVSSEDVGREV